MRFGIPDAHGEKYVCFGPAAPEFEVPAAFKAANLMFHFVKNDQKIGGLVWYKSQFYNAFDHG